MNAFDFNWITSLGFKKCKVFQKLSLHPVLNVIVHKCWESEYRRFGADLKDCSTTLQIQDIREGCQGDMQYKF